MGGCLSSSSSNPTPTPTPGSLTIPDANVAAQQGASGGNAGEEGRINSPADLKFSPQLWKLFEESVADDAIKQNLLESTLGKGYQNVKTDITMDCPKKTLHLPGWRYVTTWQPILTRNGNVTQFIFAGKYNDPMICMMEQLLALFDVLKKLYPDCPELSQPVQTWESQHHATMFCSFISRSFARMMGTPYVQFSFPMSKTEDEEMYCCILNAGGSPYMDRQTPQRFLELMTHGWNRVRVLPFIDLPVAFEGWMKVAEEYGVRATALTPIDAKEVKETLETVGIFSSYTETYNIPGWHRYLILVDNCKATVQFMSRPDRNGNQALIAIFAYGPA